jgi:hypothetical protein
MHYVNRPREYALTCWPRRPCSPRAEGKEPTRSVDYAYDPVYLPSLSNNAFNGGQNPGCITHQ